MPELTEARMHFGPGELWTGTKRYACDGAIIVVHYRTDGDERRVENVVIEQLHDINIARHRNRTETREHLRRCLKLFTREGMILIKGDDTDFVRPESVGTSSKLTLHAFHRSERRHGPFSATTPDDDGG